MVAFTAPSLVAGPWVEFLLSVQSWSLKFVAVNSLLCLRSIVVADFRNTAAGQLSPMTNEQEVASGRDLSKHANVEATHEHCRTSSFLFTNPVPDDTLSLMKDVNINASY